MGETDRIGPDMSPKKTMADRVNSLRKTFFTKQGLIGDYDYAFLFRPNIPFLKKDRRASPFFGLHDQMPLVLAMLLGFQHALAMLAGIMTPPIILSGQGGVNLPVDWQQYLVSTSCKSTSMMIAFLEGAFPDYFHSDRLRYSIIHPDHQVPHLANAILHWHWIDFCRRHVFRHHSCRHWRICTDVRQWKVSN